MAQAVDLDKLKAINQCFDCKLTEVPLYGVNLSIEG